MIFFQNKSMAYNQCLFSLEGRRLFLAFDMAATKVDTPNDPKEKVDKQGELTKKEFDRLADGGVEEDLKELKKRKDEDVKKILSHLGIDDINKLPESIKKSLGDLDSILEIENKKKLQIDEINKLIRRVEFNVNMEHDVEFIRNGMNTGEFLSIGLYERLSRVSDYKEISSKLKPEDIINIDFSKNRKLEQQISAAHIFPPNVQKIRVDHSSKNSQSANTLEGVRDGLTGEFWALDENGNKKERLKIWSGTKITILEPDKGKDVTSKGFEVLKKKQELPKKTREEMEKDENIKKIVETALSKGIDPEFMIAVYKKENGNKGKEFGVMLPGVDSSKENKENFDQQLGMSMTILARHENQYLKEYRGSSLKINDKNNPSYDKYTPHFIAYFSEKYSPSDVNSNDINNLSEIYFEGDDKSQKEAEEAHKEVKEKMRGEKQEVSNAKPEKVTTWIKNLKEINIKKYETMGSGVLCEIIQRYTNLEAYKYEKLHKDFHPIVVALLEICNTNGVTLRLSSGFRDNETNKSSNGDKYSLHQLGLKADFVPASSAPYVKALLEKYFPQVKHFDVHDSGTGSHIDIGLYKDFDSIPKDVLDGLKVPIPEKFRKR